jgi:monoamine oxidase
MTVYTDGVDATQINSLSKDQNKLNRYIESQLSLLLERKVPKIKTSWVFYWPKGISSWKPSDKPVEQVLPILQHPYPNIHFCGDSYSMHPGWLEGAVESSDQVIQHILKS